MRALPLALAVTTAVTLAACSAAPAEDDAEGARAAAELYLHRIGAGDARGVCALGLARDGRTPLSRVPDQRDECVRLFTAQFQGDNAKAYARLTDARVTRVTVQGDHASVAKADTVGAEGVVRNDRTIALLRVDGSWYVGSDDRPTRQAPR